MTQKPQFWKHWARCQTGRLQLHLPGGWAGEQGQGSYLGPIDGSAGFWSKRANRRPSPPVTRSRVLPAAGSPASPLRRCDHLGSFRTHGRCVGPAPRDPVSAGRGVTRAWGFVTPARDSEPTTAENPPLRVAGPGVREARPARTGDSCIPTNQAYVCWGAVSPPGSVESLGGVVWG